jgi:hypothetical protein
VQTGVKSAGCENSIVHLLSKNLWKSYLKSAYFRNLFVGVPHHVSMSSLRLEVRRYAQSVSFILLFLIFLKHDIPMDPSLSRGCSAGSASPRRNSGAAGRCTLRAGRAEERRAREAARGKNEAIVKFAECNQVPEVFSEALVLCLRRRCKLVIRGLFGMASCQIKWSTGPKSAPFPSSYCNNLNHCKDGLCSIYRQHMKVFELMLRVEKAATALPCLCHATRST